MNKVIIKEVLNIDEKQRIIRLILEALPEWFAIEQAREEYIQNSKDYIMLASFIEDEPIGFICLKETSTDTVEISLIGILKEYHHKGIGKALFKKAKEIAIHNNYSFMQVKTVQMGTYEEYDKTNHFYLSLGFKELEVLKDYWDEANPCQIYIMSLF